MIVPVPPIEELPVNVLPEGSIVGLHAQDACALSQSGKLVAVLLGPALYKNLCIDTPSPFQDRDDRQGKDRMTYRIAPYREARDIGTVWPVQVVHGKCDCGSCEMTNYVAFFVCREDAEKFVADKAEESK